MHIMFLVPIHKSMYYQLPISFLFACLMFLCVCVDMYNILIFCIVCFYDRDSSLGLKHHPQQNLQDGGSILTATHYKDAEM